jgi:hypothetical protein
MATIEHVTDRVLAGGDVGEVARGGLDAGVAQALGDDVNRDLLGGERDHVVGAQDVRILQALGVPAASAWRVTISLSPSFDNRSGAALSCRLTRTNSGWPSRNCPKRAGGWTASQRQSRP